MAGLTYAALIDQGHRLAHQGTQPPWSGPFSNDAAARRALEARLHLLDAIAEHVWAIVGPARRTGTSHGSDPTERTAVALATELRALTGEHLPARIAATGSHPWARAAVTVRAASDLLAIHHDQLSRPRSPDAQAWKHSTDRATTLATLGPLTHQVLDAEGVLAMRTAQAALPWAQIRRLLPETTAAREMAASLAHHAASGPAEPFARLTLIGEPPRLDSATHELTDRMARIRQLTWELLNHPDQSTATLRDLATLATAIHAHTAAHHTTPDTPDSKTVTLLHARAKAWQHTAHDLADYLTPAPGHREIHDQVRATIRALSQLAPLAPGTAPPASKRPAEREPVTAALRSAVATTEKTQDWAAQIFGRLADRTDLYVPAHVLTGAQVTDDPELVRAKLTGTRTPAPPARTAQTIEHYRIALPPGSSLTPRAPTSVVEQNLVPMVIGRAG